jgi:hypothetical protein
VYICNVNKAKQLKQNIMKITNKQLIKLSNLRKDLIELYNNNHGGINYTMIRDLDQTIEEIIKK